MPSFFSKGLVDQTLQVHGPSELLFFVFSKLLST